MAIDIASIQVRYGSRLECGSFFCEFGRYPFAPFIQKEYGKSRNRRARNQQATVVQLEDPATRR